MITENDIQKVQIDKIEEVLRAKLKNLIIATTKFHFYIGDIKIHIDADTQDIKLRYDYDKPLHFTYDINTVSDADLENIAEQFLQTTCEYYAIYSVILVKKDKTKTVYYTCRYDRDQFTLLSFLTSDGMIEVTNAIYDDENTEEIKSIEIYDENAREVLCRIEPSEYYSKNRRYKKGKESENKRL